MNQPELFPEAPWTIGYKVGDTVTDTLIPSRIGEVTDVTDTQVVVCWLMPNGWTHLTSHGDGRWLMHKTSPAGQACSRQPADDPPLHDNGRGIPAGDPSQEAS